MPCRVLPRSRHLGRSRAPMTHGPCWSQESHQESTIVGCPFPAVCRRLVRTSNHVLSCSAFELPPSSFPTTRTQVPTPDYAPLSPPTRPARRRRRPSFSPQSPSPPLSSVPLQRTRVASYSHVSSFTKSLHCTPAARLVSRDNARRRRAPLEHIPAIFAHTGFHIHSRGLPAGRGLHQQVLARLPGRAGGRGTCILAAIGSRVRDSV
ncbi:hypothetical protein BD626DRAFT_107286 [Schizophyllum amplum]|uniref:Uncharacterized protein n=1 Tax=Schizophyllum amplum TaxID=97359 RepID=A0A550CSU9_9AGAR|nr:hypothetical protein BD626DRAFT_107286 [Auriculariopsis ampla]